MADVPKTGMPYSELPEKEEFDENDEIFCLNEGYGERAKVSTFVDEVAGMGNADHMISDAFDEERDYTAGEYCIYDNSLYKFTEDKEAGEWDDNVVEITTVSGEIQENTDLIDSLLYIESYTSESYTITAGEYADWTQNVSKSGYTILGIVQFYTDGNQSSYCVTYRLRIVNGSDLRFAVRNFGSSTATTTLNATILYQKNS